VSAATRRRQPQLRPALIPGGLGDRKWADRRFPQDILIVDADGHVLEAAWANLFIVENGRHITPPLDGRILPGVTRAQLRADEEPITLERYEAADAVYLTSAVSLITPVRGAASAPSESAVLPAGPGSSSGPGR
jgi:para-aminobenzoate synthetase/4-amino-4-deoxychorismate lyase